jgi:hypothetical protein
MIRYNHVPYETNDYLLVGLRIRSQQLFKMDKPVNKCKTITETQRQMPYKTHINTKKYLLSLGM